MTPTKNVTILVEETIKALTDEMQRGSIDPVITNGVLTQLTYIKFKLESKVNNVNCA